MIKLLLSFVGSVPVNQTHETLFNQSAFYISAVNVKLLLNTVKYSTFIYQSLPKRPLSDLSKIVERVQQDATG